LALQHASDKRKVALISGGELTVSVRGAGEGGPNQEYALSLAIALDGAENISALAADTDGTDGGSGSANDPAGAVVDEMTIRNAQRFGMIPNDYLLSNNSTSFFRIVGGLLTPGPTLTNVNDLRIILIDQRND
jgi:hydroxypyruvate reductase